LLLNQNTGKPCGLFHLKESLSGVYATRDSDSSKEKAHQLQVSGKYGVVGVHLTTTVYRNDPVCGPACKNGVIARAANCNSVEDMWTA
jgi:hypothetical protein